MTNGTDNHLMLVNLKDTEITGKELQNKCDSVYITLNKNAVPNDPRSPFITSGVRIGTPAVTTRGMKEEPFDLPTSHGEGVIFLAGIGSLVAAGILAIVGVRLEKRSRKEQEGKRT